MKKLVVKLLIATVLIGAIALAAVILMPPQTINVPLSGGGNVRIKPISLLRSLWGAPSKILYEANGLRGEVDLWQDFADRPVLVEPVPGTNIFLCLYDCDTGLQLLRVDPNRKFTPGRGTNADMSSAVVCASPWEVADANIRDWRQFSEYLKSTPASVLRSQIVCPFPFGLSRSQRLSGTVSQVEAQKKFMIENRADHWPVTTTLRYPIAAANQ